MTPSTTPPFPPDPTRPEPISDSPAVGAGIRTRGGHPEGISGSPAPGVGTPARGNRPEGISVSPAPGVGTPARGNRPEGISVSPAPGVGTPARGNRPEGISDNSAVGVVIPTRGDRAEWLRDAVRGVLAQEYVREVVVVADGVDAQTVAGQVAGLPVRVLPNRLSPGLPGARNTGVAACATDLVAFCDDDDVWLPGKLTAQVAAMAAAGAWFASCGIEVEYGGRLVPRLAGTGTVTADDLVRSRMVMVHSSTFLFRRGAIWVDESAPGGQNEDWDLALRAAKLRPIACADRPLVRVRWGRSHYVSRWPDRIAGLEWMLARHPELARDPRGGARVYGQLAFAHAALRRRRTAARWAARTIAARPAELRAPLALAVAAGLLPASAVLSLLHHRGRGI
ncbi:glycosyltransferase [Nonomuraea sp. NPDC048826]|uniref:glycosyltransferase family 2 protein n=1 Tax=Nonomuraea sp. NPDC048826 TaxID=3364347 RepID=UPI0037193E1B